MTNLALPSLFIFLLELTQSSGKLIGKYTSICIYHLTTKYKNNIKYNQLKKASVEMIDSKLILELVERGTKGDTPGFQILVRRLASKIKKSDPDFAEKLISQLPETDTLRGVSPIMPSPIDADTRQKLLIEYNPVHLDREPIWNDELKTELNRVIFERKNAHKLNESGLVPVRSVLFEGAPGLGKTLAAKWLARELNLPLLILDLATVMSSFLGKTGNNIRAVLNHASTFPCVLLLDEFDAIAKRRDDDHDVGELKRLVTVLLQAIDDWTPSSLLVAATNHGELLDPAVWRRFDINVHFRSPTLDEIKELLSDREIDQKTISLMAKTFVGKSFSDIERRINSLRKASLLEERSLYEVCSEHYFRSAVDVSEKEQRDIEVLRLHSEGKSQREIHRLTNISRPTIKKIIDKAKGG